jgi:tetratricopeptide (TPR) repeat protein
MTSPKPLICALLLCIPLWSSANVLSSIDSLQKVLRAHPSGDSARAVLLNTIAFEAYLTDPELSLRCAYEAIEISRQVGYLAGEAEALRQVGIVLWAQGKYSSALKNFMAGLRLAEKTNDKQIIADITGNIGLVYHGLADFDQSLDYHKKSLEMQRELNNTPRQSVSMNNMGDVQRARKNYTEAISYYTQALHMREQAKNMSGVATNQRNIGNVYEELGDFSRAMEQYTLSLHLSDSLREKRGMSQCRYSLASVYFRQKKYEMAKRFLMESISISKEAGFKSYLRDAYLLLSQVNESQKNYEQAFVEFQNHALYRDSVINLRVTAEIAAYRLEYETSKKQDEINNLKKDAELDKSIIARKNTLLVSGSLVVVLLMCAAIILYKNITIQKNSNLILENKNREIAFQHQEISAQRDELMTLNEEIRAQQEDLMMSRDALAEKNASIESMNQKMIDINRDLERLVAQRTEALEKQNEQLLSYAFINAHKLRAPLARVMGLTHLLTISTHSDEQQKIVKLLDDATLELDDVTKSITEVVEKGITALDIHNNPKANG